MDADTLRLILIVVGTALVLALYLWERSRSEEDDDESDTPSGLGKREPTVGAVDLLHPADPLDPAPAADPEEVPVEVKGRGWAAAVATFQAASRRADTVPQAALHLVADASEPDPDEPGGANTLILQVGVRVRAGKISGPDLLDVAAHCGLRPGELGAFHRKVLAGDEAGAGPSGDSAGPDDDGEELRTLFSMASMIKPGEFPFDAMDEFRTPGVILYAILRRGFDNLPVLDEMIVAARRLADEFDAEVVDERRAPLTAIMVDVLRARVMEFERGRRPRR